MIDFHKFCFCDDDDDLGHVDIPQKSKRTLYIEDKQETTQYHAILAMQFGTIFSYFFLSEGGGRTYPGGKLANGRFIGPYIKLWG